MQFHALLVSAMKTQMITKTIVGFGNAGLPPGSLQMNDYLMQGTLPVAKVIMLILSDFRTIACSCMLRKAKGKNKR